MKDLTGKLLVVESDDTLRDTLITMVEDAGYKVLTDHREGMKAVLAFEPDLVILGADPPQLDCFGLLSEIKGSKHTRNVRVVMLVYGNSAKRARGLNLGADDVLMLPLNPPELLSRIRSQVRNKQIVEEIWEWLHFTEESHNANERVVRAVREEKQMLLAGATAVVLGLVIVGLVSLVLYCRGHADSVLRTPEEPIFAVEHTTPARDAESNAAVTRVKELVGGSATETIQSLTAVGTNRAPDRRARGYCAEGREQPPRCALAATCG